MRSANPPVSVLGVIPARLASTRLPRKVLRLVAGQPLLAWVVEAALACPSLDRVLVAVDSDEVASLCEQHNWPYEMTSPDLLSGTDRLYAVSGRHPASLYVNIQADEPLLTPAHLRALLAPFVDPAVEVATLRTPCHLADLSNANVVKVVTAHSGRALYFSRAAIPFQRDRLAPAVSTTQYWKHQGFYAYRAAALTRFASLPPSSLERIECLEQLRLLENGMTLHVADSPADTLGVDTEADLQAMEQLLKERQRTGSLL